MYLSNGKQITIHKIKQSKHATFVFFISTPNLMLYIGIAKIFLMIGEEGKMVKEKYKQLCLHHQYGGIYTIVRQN